MGIKRNNFYLVILAIGLLIHISLVTITIFSTSPTYDEGGHVYSGLLYLTGDHLDYYSNNPPFEKYLFGISAHLFTNPRVTAPPVGVENWYKGASWFMSANGPHYLDIINAARFVSLLFSVIGCLLAYFLVGKFLGKRIALITVILWAFNPAMISLAALATTDMAASVLFMSTVFALWRYKEKSNISSAWLVGILASLAVLTKFSNILLYIFALPLMIAVFIYQRHRKTSLSCATFTTHIIAVVVVSVLICGATYGWQGMPVRLAELDFHSKLLSGSRPVLDFMGSKNYLNNGNRFKSGLLGVIGEIPLPIPEKMLLGFDSQIGQEDYGLLAYLDGQWKKGGWIYYYIYTLFLKTPIFILLIWFFSLIFWLNRLDFRLSRTAEIFLLVPALIFFIVTSMATGINSHSRYILPVIPFLLIWVARGIDYILIQIDISYWKQAYKKQLAIVILSILLIWPVVQIHPYYLSYFNGLVGGPKNGWKYLIDSNIDWGQDLLNLKKWLDDHPEVDVLKLAYFGTTRPDLVIDESRFIVATPLGQSQTNKKQTVIGTSIDNEITPGWYAVSVNLLVGLPTTIYGNYGRYYLSRKCAFCTFQSFEPVDRVGYSIYIYHLSEQDITDLSNKDVIDIYTNLFRTR